MMGVWTTRREPGGTCPDCGGSSAVAISEEDGREWGRHHEFCETCRARRSANGARFAAEIRSRFPSLVGDVRLYNTLARAFGPLDRGVERLLAATDEELSGVRNMGRVGLAAWRRIRPVPRAVWSESDPWDVHASMVALCEASAGGAHHGTV